MPPKKTASPIKVEAKVELIKSKPASRTAPRAPPAPKTFIINHTCVCNGEPAVQQQPAKTAPVSSAELTYLRKSVGSQKPDEQFPMGTPVGLNADFAFLPDYIVAAVRMMHQLRGEEPDAKKRLDLISRKLYNGRYHKLTVADRAIKMLFLDQLSG